MSEPPPSAGGGYEIVIHVGRRGVWRTRARLLRRGASAGGRAAGHVAGVAGAAAGRATVRSGRAGLVRLADYLRTPEGRRTALRGAGALAVLAAGIGAIVWIREWIGGWAGRLSGLGAGFRRAAGTLGGAARAAGAVLSLRWLSALGRWLWLSATFRRYVPCPQCHARVCRDAAVCYGCGYRPGAGTALGEVASRRSGLAGPLVWLSRALILRLYSSCPDCRRAVHADARVCRHCGNQLRG